ncbi:Transposable element tcb1 transposase, partial [Caligus rogercresseyi]
IAKSFKESEDTRKASNTGKKDLDRSQIQDEARDFIENLDMFWSKKFWPLSSHDLNPCDYYLWGVLERDTNKRAHNPVDSLKAAIIRRGQLVQGTACSCRWEVQAPCEVVLCKEEVGLMKIREKSFKFGDMKNVK